MQSPRRPLNSPLLDHEIRSDAKTPAAMHDLASSHLLPRSARYVDGTSEALRFGWAWMALTMMSQAGVALGLALETKTRFSRWGEDFATLILAVVVINQLIGPPLCKVGLLYLCKPENGKQRRLSIAQSSENTTFNYHDETAHGQGEDTGCATTRAGEKLHRPVVTLQSPSSYLSSTKSMRMRGEKSKGHDAVFSPTSEIHGTDDGGSYFEARGSRGSSNSIRLETAPSWFSTESSTAYASLARSPRRPPRTLSEGTDLVYL